MENEYWFLIGLIALIIQWWVIRTATKASSIHAHQRVIVQLLSRLLQDRGVSKEEIEKLISETNASGTDLPSLTKDKSAVK